MITITYMPIRRYATRTGKCPVCGKRATRRRVFAETVNPYHPAVNAQMSEAEATRAVDASVMAAAQAWRPDFTHEKCREATR